jgi:glutamate 5-kinase
VNENDTVAIHELKIGDNDTMAAQVASLVGADYCFLLTDVNGLYSSNPNVRTCNFFQATICRSCDSEDLVTK